MSKELRRARNRQMLVFLLIGFGMLVLLGRLYYWQVLQSHSGYNLAQQANNEHTQNLVLNAPRGLIYDDQGHILATNVVRDDVYVEPIQFSIDHPDNTASCRCRDCLTLQLFELTGFSLLLWDPSGARSTNHK